MRRKSTAWFNKRFTASAQAHQVPARTLMVTGAPNKSSTGNQAERKRETRKDAFVEGESVVGGNSEAI